MSLLVRICSSSIVVFGFAGVILAEEAAVVSTDTAEPLLVPRNIHEFATKPEGAVLPERVARFRYIYTAYKGQDHGYDKDGNKSSVPLDLNIKGGAIVGEYGITNELSFQFLQKFVTSYDLSTNNSRALDYTADSRSSSKSKLKAAICAGLGVPADSCDAAVAANPAAATAAALNASPALQAAAPGIAFDANTPLSSTVGNYVDSAAITAVSQSQVNGAKGLGDLEIGVLWSPKTDSSLKYAVGTGFRLPMNKNLAASGEGSITRNSPEFAIRTNLDYFPCTEADIAWQNQAEVGISSGKYKIGDTDATYTRKGVRNQGFVVVKPSLASLNESLMIFGPKLGFSYDYGNEEYVKMGSADTVSAGPRGYEVSYYLGLNTDFFPYGAPLNMELLYEKSIRGKNVEIAIDTTQIQLKGYYKF